MAPTHGLRGRVQGDEVVQHTRAQARGFLLPDQLLGAEQQRIQARVEPRAHEGRVAEHDETEARRAGRHFLVVDVLCDALAVKGAREHRVLVGVHPVQEPADQRDRCTRATNSQFRKT